jgi:hypothetical protein
MSIQQQCIDAYRKHRNLKLAAGDVGIPWQSVYVQLRNADEPVMGDKLRYGSDSDKLAARGEQIFQSLVPGAVSHNDRQYQSKLDFNVRNYGVDVKISTLRLSNKACKVRRWAFCTKKQEMSADFVVCFGLNEQGDSLVKALLIPGEVVRKYATVSLSERGGKWDDYSIEPADLNAFFAALPPKQ